MRRVCLIQLDGSLPNIALMRLAAHHSDRGNSVEFRYATKPRDVERRLWDHFDEVYASAIFERTRPVARRLRQVYPAAVIGGTGIDLVTTLESIGVETKAQDYSIYPRWSQSIGFTQRGCRLKCPFCVVPRKEGAVREENSIWGLWRGDPFPREIILLDNDFFGQSSWERRIEEIRAGRFRVAFSQGINARALTDETAAAIAGVDYRSNSMKERRIYTAWDNRKDEARLFQGLELLVKHGVRPGHIMVFMLCGYWPGETHEDREYRRRRLREFGADPYPMPYVRTPELVGFLRWVHGAYDKRIPWDAWKAAGYRPERLADGRRLPLFPGDGP